MSTVYFLIPMFNEEQNLPVLRDNLLAVLPNEKKHFVFVDDGSNDHSVAVAKQLFPPNQLTVLGDGSNHGPGFSFNIGFEWLLANCKVEEDIIVTLEADNTSDLSILPVLIGNVKMGFDMVLASIYAQGGGFEKTSLARKILSAVANLIMRFIFDIKVQTLSSFYRAYHPTVLQKIKKNKNVIITESGFLCMIELLIKAIQADAKILEVPMVLYSSKRKGKSKMKILKTTLSYVRFMFLKKA